MKAYLKIQYLFFVVTIFLSSCSRSTDEIVLIQSKPKLTTVDLGQPGASYGDLLIYKGDLKTKDGKASGKLQGCLITVDLPESNGNADDADEDRFGTLIFQFNEQDNLVVGGVSNYQSQQVEMQDNLPQVRAITGGTGKFLTARGQLTTIKNPDGTYTHTFEIVN
ncbi:MAG: hypothetical protein ABI840_08530 [bacterium]